MKEIVEWLKVENRNKTEFGLFGVTYLDAEQD